MTGLLSVVRASGAARLANALRPGLRHRTGGPSRCVRVLVVLTATWVWTAWSARASVADPEGAGGASPVEEGAPGTVAVFPSGGEDPPGIERTLQVLHSAGFDIPDYQTRFVDGGTILADVGAGWHVVGPVRPVACPGGVDGWTLGEWRQAVDRADHHILLTNYDQALELLQGALGAVPCAHERLPPDLLYRMHFLLGVVAQFQDDEEAAIAWFERAAAIDPTQGFDPSFPPKAWQAYVKARDSLYLLPTATLRVYLETEPAALYLDGHLFSGDEGVTFPVGYHVIQVALPEAEGAAPTLQTLAVQVEGGGPLWLVDAGTTARLTGVRTESARSREMAVFVDVLAQWARARGDRWVLALFLGPGGRALERSLFVDAATYELTAPPEWMVLSPAAVDLLAEGVEGGKRPPGSSVLLAGWDVAGSICILQPLPPAKRRLYAIEIGGLRTIQGNVSAHVAMDLGLNLVSGQGTEGIFTGFVAGVRWSWEVAPFGLYLEGALSGFNVTGAPATLGGQARVGTYYRLVPGGRSVFGLWLATSYVFLAPAGEHWMGVFGVGFRYHL